jgi:truncated hemoglobin YjbI
MDSGSSSGSPTVFEWAGGAGAFSRLTDIFYGHVKDDPLLAPVFAEMSPEHPEWVAQWLGEVFGGPTRYTAERGGYPHMIGRHLGRALTEPQRARWVRLLGEAADEAGFPTDPEFRSAFVAYLEWGSRIALANSQPGAEPPPHMPVPRWSWGQAGLPGSALGPSEPAPEARANDPVEPLAAGIAPGFEHDIRPLFTARDITSMQWAFDLTNYEAVRQHAQPILDQLRAGSMPCYGAWPAAQVALFQRWIESGLLP